MDTSIFSQQNKTTYKVALFLSIGLLLASFIVYAWYWYSPQQHASQAVSLNAFERLMAGNVRFATGAPLHPDESTRHRKEVATGQHPFAVVIACSDSRLSPELIFDQGLGDLFVIRTAGNLISDLELGSIEYAVEHLGASTIVVLGHEHCGAVEALMSAEKPHGHIKTIIDSLRREIEMKDALANHDVHAAVVANVHHQVQSIITDPLITELAARYPITVKGAIYAMESGKVHPLESIVVAPAQE